MAVVAAVEGSAIAVVAVSVTEVATGTTMIAIVIVAATVGMMIAEVTRSELEMMMVLAQTPVRVTRSASRLISLKTSWCASALDLLSAT